MRRMDPNLVLDQKLDKGPGIDEMHEQQRIDKTKEYQDKFVEKVDPFGKNVKKKIIKTSTIKFVADDANGQAFAKAKKANLPVANVSRGMTNYAQGEGPDEIEELKDEPVRKVQRNRTQQ